MREVSHRMWNDTRVDTLSFEGDKHVESIYGQNGATTEEMWRILYFDVTSF